MLTRPHKHIQMPYRALSEHVKLQNKARVKEAKLQAALAEYTLEQTKPLHERRGARSIATAHGITTQWRTILTRHNGGRSIREAHEDQRNLTPAEEIVLVHFLEESASRGYPQSLTAIQRIARTIQENRCGSGAKIGDDWSARFLDRHRDVLQTHWSKHLDTSRARAMNPEAKKQWFQLVEDFIVKLGIKPENLYAMDETGCPPSDQGTGRVVGGRGTKTQHKQGGGGHENVTAIVTIFADGSKLKPTIIFKG